MGWTALALLAGIAGSFWLPALPGIGVLVLLAGFAVLGLGLGWRIAGCATAGFVLACLHAQASLRGDLPCGEQRQRLEASGWIASIPEQRPGRLDFDFLTVQDGASRRLRVTWYEAGETPAVGERWRLPLRLRCRRAHLNPGVFDRELDLLRRGFSGTAYVAPRDGKPLREAIARGWPIQRARAAVGVAIAGAVDSPDSAAVLQGLAVGLRAALRAVPSVASGVGAGAAARDGDGLGDARFGGIRRTFRCFGTNGARKTKRFRAVPAALRHAGRANGRRHSTATGMRRLNCDGDWCNRLRTVTTCALSKLRACALP